jgi:iron(III) transport system substrate-binding protein
MNCKNVPVLLICLFTMIVAGDVAAQSWEQVLQKIYPAAKAEGEVVYNTGAGDIEVGGKEGIAKFSKRFPGVKISIIAVSSTQLYPRVIAESRAGSLTVDMDVDDPQAVKLLIERGLIQSLNPAQLTDKPERLSFMFDNKLPVARHQITHLAYNTNLVPKADLPKTYEDLLNPKWKGKLSLDGRGMWGFTHLRLLWGEDRFWKFIKAFPEQKPLWNTRCNTATDRVVTGEAYIGCLSFSRLNELKAKGAPIEFLPISPVFVRAEVFVPYKAAPHPNAAKLLMGWMLSPEGMDAVDKEGTGFALPGTRAYNSLRSTGAELYFADKLTMEQLILLEQTREEIAKVWGAVK